MFNRTFFQSSKFIHHHISYLARPSIGRWEIHYDPKVTFQKVDWANEDHCGVCENKNIPTNDPYTIETIGCMLEIT